MTWESARMPTVTKEEGRKEDGNWTNWIELKVEREATAYTTVVRTIAMTMLARMHNVAKSAKLAAPCSVRICVPTPVYNIMSAW